MPAINLSDGGIERPQCHAGVADATCRLSTGFFDCCRPVMRVLFGCFAD
jgi:hypothetical protein